MSTRSALLWDPATPVALAASTPFMPLRHTYSTPPHLLPRTHRLLYFLHLPASLSTARSRTIAVFVMQCDYGLGDTTGTRIKRFQTFRMWTIASKHYEYARGDRQLKLENINQSKYYESGGERARGREQGERAQGKWEQGGWEQGEWEQGEWEQGERAQLVG
ncbi:hypothetical protein GY45DRAFT_1341564 [Cubamyces sp. BRFM 1775]|nr:hypothetical protein GY45DRAFT_1341564 [Cubamyces sp. BRFM 1775]